MAIQQMKGCRFQAESFARRKAEKQDKKDAESRNGSRSFAQNLDQQITTIIAQSVLLQIRCAAPTTWELSRLQVSMCKRW